MWRGWRLNMKTAIIGLLMAAALLVQVAPLLAASSLLHGLLGAAHEEVAADKDNEAFMANPNYEHDQAAFTFRDVGTLDGEAGCNVVQCTNMLGGIPIVETLVFFPHAGKPGHLTAPELPKGLIINPALRPPRLTD